MSGEKRNWLGVPVQSIPMSWVLRHCEGAARQGVSIEAVPGLGYRLSVKNA